MTDLQQKKSFSAGLPPTEHTGAEFSGSQERRDIFRKQGYMVIKGALDPERDLEPLADAYARLTDELVGWVMGDLGHAALQGYEAMDFPKRFASLIGITRGGVFNHIGPSLSVYEWGYRRWSSAPSAQPPELFDLERNPRILDAVEELIGPEIWVSPAYHVNMKLGTRHLQTIQRAESDARDAGLKLPPVVQTGPFNQDFQMGETHWHMDAYPGQGHEFEHQYIIAWVPVTTATVENGALMVLPGSHLDGYCDFPDKREDEAIALETEPGDIVIMDGKLFHKSTPNRTQNTYRLAFNMRYAPIGYRCGRCFLPGFVGRSRKKPDSELHDAELWRACWDQALDFLYRYEVPAPHIELTVPQVDRLQKRWQKRITDQHDWLQLQDHGNFLKSLRTRLFRTTGFMRYYISRMFGVGRYYR